MAKRPVRTGLRAVGLVVLVLATLLAVRSAQQRTGSTTPSSGPPAPVVTVATPLSREVTEWDDYVGRFRASQAVEVRPRVAGEITGVFFTDGQVVEKGQLLFTIDQRRLLAGQGAARADLESARSSLALAKADLTRGQYLTGHDAVSVAALDQLKARAEAATAAVDGAQARLDDRNLDVEFSQVRAPISGRTSDRRVDVGNEVAGAEGNTGTLLTTIDALDPIYFDFDASETLFLKGQRAGRKTVAALPVQIRLQDEAGYAWDGTVDFTDNAVNPHSGTIHGRATVANPSGFLRPGLFGNMRLAYDAKTRALLVPDAAVQTDQARRIVYVVEPDGTVSAREVEPGALVDGLRVIHAGLTASDEIVIEGVGLAPGMKVAPQVGVVQPRKRQGSSVVQSPPAAEATVEP